MKTKNGRKARRMSENAGPENETAALGKETGEDRVRKIVTVTGEISPERLGFCQFHEHLLIRGGRSREINDALYMDDTDLSAQEAKRYFSAGGRSLIDAQPGGCGRMAEGLARISERTGVSIICSAGFHKMCFYPGEHWIFREDEKSTAEFFLRELTEGVDNDCDLRISGNTGKQKAGIVKCALDKENLSPQYKKLFRAAAYAASEADRILMIHIEKGSDPLELLDFLKAEGFSPERTVYCHLDRAKEDLSVHTKILEAGAFLEFDTIGRFKYHSDERETEIIKHHIDEGFVGQLLFSLDTTRTRLAAYGPTETGLDYILRVFIGKMLDAGITKEEIRRISTVNPVRALTGVSVDK